jgi:uncharacterized membrane protein YvbJ
MAIIQCEKCGKETSDRLDQCNHCANPHMKQPEQHNPLTSSRLENDSEPKSDVKGWLGCLGAFILLLILIGSCSGGPKEQFDPTNPDHLDAIFDE